MTEKNGPPVQRVSELVSGQNLFESHGYTRLRVTKPGWECMNCGKLFISKKGSCPVPECKPEPPQKEEVREAGVPIIHEFPIKSTGAADYIESLMEKAPTPPKRLELIKKGSEEGQKLGLKHSEMHVRYDQTDEDYIKALDAHNQNFIWRVAIFALDIKWTKTDGTQAANFDEKVEILKSNDIHGHHIDRIYGDVVALTHHEEDRQDFLPGNF